MKKILTILCIALLTNVGLAQQPAPLIWGVSPYQNELYATDTTNWTATINLQPSITGTTITGLTGLAYDPTAYKSYVIVKDGSSRYLAEINLQTAVCTVKGDLGDNFSSITFDESGQLYGTTGDGAATPSGFFKIDKATAASTLVFTMGNGDDGESICFNRFDNKMYHWSGNGSPVFESWPITNTSYNPTGITIPSTADENFGALCLKANGFIISNISSEFRHLSTSGVFSSALSNNPDALRGIIMPPRFALNTATVCQGNPLNLYSNCLQLYDSVYYYWGDGGVTQLLGTSASTAGVSHNYPTAGNYTITVRLYNGVVAKSTFTTFAVVVHSKPVVNISGTATMCVGSTTTLNASGGGSSQWYNNGVLIPGATQNSYTVTAPGWYNMIKTNLNGCSDSAANGVNVVAISGASVTVNNGTICSGNSFVISPSGATNYTITGGTFTVSPPVTTSYSVTGASTMACPSNTAVSTVVVNQTPTITVTSSKATICKGETAILTATGATNYQWQLAGTTNTLAVSPTVTSTYVVAGNNAVCSATMSFVQQVSECAGISESKTAATQIIVMPNPGSGVFFVESKLENITIEVFDALGKSVLKTTSVGNKTKLDLSANNNGLYFVRVSHNDSVLSHLRIIKE